MRRILAPLIAILLLAGCGSSSPSSSPSPRPVAIPPPADSPATCCAAAPGVGHTTAPGEISHGPRTHRWVALTFDADMTRVMLARLHSGAQRTWYDAEIVRELRATRTPATIFLTGLWTSTYPNVVRELAADRLFELENHSVDHAGWLAPCYGLPVVRGELSKRAEIENAAATIRSVAGITPRYFRFPGGCRNASDVQLVDTAGEQAVGWDVVAADPFQRDPQLIVRAVLGGVRPGSIVVMHIVGPPNAPATNRALPEIISSLRARGYRFVTLQRLLGGR